jgi:hypothetical protein
MSKVSNEKKINVKALTAHIFSKILYKVNFSKKKGNQQLIGIDLLKTETKKDLLLISVLKIEETYIKVLEKSEPIKVMQENGEELFLKCLKNICENFLTKQYGYKVEVNLLALKNSLYTKALLKDLELFFQIPFYALIDPRTPIFQFIYAPVYNFASESFIEALIDHMVLEISNCTVYFSVVKFSSVHAFRQTLYRSKFLSLRNFERFKNNLDWQLVTKTYIQRPVDLYNNRYEILILRTNGIYCRTIYANRSKEIAYLNNFSLLAITFIELRDFIVNRLDEIIYFLSKSLRFVFTSIFGQIIGLVWRGVIEGLKK